MLIPKTLQNTSDWEQDKPTIVIEKDSPEWEESYKNWLQGKNPTISKEWEKGVIMTFQKVIE